MPPTPTNAQRGSRQSAVYRLKQCAGFPLVSIGDLAGHGLLVCISFQMNSGRKSGSQRYWQLEGEKRELAETAAATGQEKGCGGGCGEKA